MADYIVESFASRVEETKEFTKADENEDGADHDGKSPPKALQGSWAKGNPNVADIPNLEKEGLLHRY
jgi:hypothetical protein